MENVNFIVRPINKQSPEELDLVTSRSMETVLETIPEFDKNPEKALNVFTNFTHDQMSAMFQSVFDNPDHEILVAEDLESGSLLGHTIFSVKTDDEGIRYGFGFSMYVDPQARRRGVGKSLLDAQEAWWSKKSISYALGQTHIENKKLQSLFTRQGFKISGPMKGEHFKYFELRKNYGGN